MAAADVRNGSEAALIERPKADLAQTTAKQTLRRSAQGWEPDIARSPVQCESGRMKPVLTSDRALGLACLLVGGGDTLVRVIGRITSGLPLGFLAILGRWVLYAPSSRTALRSVILFSGLACGWAFACLAVYLIQHPPSFIPPVMLSGYLTGSAVLVLWSWNLLRRTGAGDTATTRRDGAEKPGKALAHGVRRWLR
jgi:hypothetical protein